MSRLTRRGSFQFDNNQIEEKGIYVKDGNGEEIFFAEYEEAYPASCNTCTNKKTHDALTENGNVPICCLHCKWAEDLIDKWKGEKI